jgi:hypothetical protein
MNTADGNHGFAGVPFMKGTPGLLDDIDSFGDDSCRSALYFMAAVTTIWREVSG